MTILNQHNLTNWRVAWKDKQLAHKKKLERVVGFFWFAVRQGCVRAGARNSQTADTATRIKRLSYFF